MPLTKEELQLVVSVVNDDKIAKLNDLMAAERKTILDLNDAYAKGVVSQAAYDQQIARTAQGLVQHQKDLKALQAAQLDWTRAMQQGAYAIGDFMSTSGGFGQRLNSIANNVQFVGAQFGGWGIAIGLGVQALASGISLYEKSFSTSKKVISGHIQELEAQIKELEDKPIKLAVDYHDIANAKDQLDEFHRALSAFKGLGQEYTEYEKQSGAQANAILAGVPGGGGAVQKALLGAMTREAEADIQRRQNETEKVARANIAAMQARADDLARAGLFEGSEVAARKAENMRAGMSLAFQKFADERNRLYGPEGQIQARIGKLLTETRAGNQQARAELAGELKKAGLEGLARRLDDTSAAQIEANETKKAQDAREEREQKQIEESQKEASRVQAEAAVRQHMKDHPEAAPLNVRVNPKTGLFETGTDKAEAEEKARLYNTSGFADEKPPMRTYLDPADNRWKTYIDTTGWEKTAEGRWVKKQTQAPTREQVQARQKAEQDRIGKSLGMGPQIDSAEAIQAGRTRAQELGITRALGGARRQAIDMGFRGRELDQMTRQATAQALNAQGLFQGMSNGAAQALVRQVVQDTIAEQGNQRARGNELLNQSLRPDHQPRGKLPANVPGAANQAEAARRANFNQRFEDAKRDEDMERRGGAAFQAREKRAAENAVQQRTAQQQKELLAIGMHMSAQQERLATELLRQGHDANTIRERLKRVDQSLQAIRRTAQNNGR